MRPDQYARALPVVAARYPDLRWLRARRWLCGRWETDLGNGARFSLSMWATNTGTVADPRWRIDADLSQSATRLVIPVRHASHDLVDGVGVVLRCLVSSARAEGWGRVAMRLAVVELGSQANEEVRDGV